MHPLSVETVMLGIGAVAVVVLLICLIAPLVNALRNAAAPVRQVHAQVVRAQQYSNLRIPGALLGMLTSTRYGNYTSRNTEDVRLQMTYMVTFEVEVGPRVELTVHEGDFNHCQPDDTGLLTYRGSRFISFESENAASA
jgi:hypothetical protein